MDRPVAPPPLPSSLSHSSRACCAWDAKDAGKLQLHFSVEEEEFGRTRLLLSFLRAKKK